MDATIKKAVEAWLTDPAIAEADKAEIRALQQAGDEKELTDRFYRDLEFGTGGMRGLIGAGRNRMNIYTVGAAAQGLANYILRQGPEAARAGVVIACDSRRCSELFAERVACVMAGNGITAYLFEKLRPTPELSFAVRHLGCTAGAMVTASHNPPQYNGFKVYWSDGVQVIPPHDEAIIAEVRQVSTFDQVRCMAPDRARAAGLLKTAGPEVDEAFLSRVQELCLTPEISRRVGRELKIVYTPLHGAGGVLVPEALRRRGFARVICVPEQIEPDGDFPTVTYPNPEEGAALQLGIALARKEGADLVIATDPDVDRVGIAVRGPDDEFVLLTGNQIAALMIYYICETLTRRGAFPPDGALVTTIVSGDMMKVIARSYGATVIEVLTGFKWIGRMIMEFEARRKAGLPTHTFLLGAEESYGYSPATYCGDKDGVTSSCFLADMAAVAAAQGLNLYDWLEELYRRFGYFQEGVKNVTLPGKEGAEKIATIMEQLRREPPAAIGGSPVVTIADVASGEICEAASGRITGRLDLPASNVLVFTLADGTKVIARPSGTEPKIKFYVLTGCRHDSLEQARHIAAARIDAVLADVSRWVS